MLPRRWMANRLGLLASQPWWFQRCENWAMCQQSAFQIFWAHKVWIALDEMPLAASVRYVQGSHAGHLGNKIERSRNPFASLKIWVWFLCKGLTFFHHIYPQDWSPEWMSKKKGKYFPEKNISRCSITEFPLGDLQWFRCIAEVWGLFRPQHFVDHSSYEGGIGGDSRWGKRHKAPEMVTGLPWFTQCYLMDALPEMHCFASQILWRVSTCVRVVG